MRLLFLLLFCSSLLTAQFTNRMRTLPQDTVARVGSSVITAADFLERFELMPWIGKDRANLIENSKKEFLQSLVAEKLMALEATAQNMGNDSIAMALQRNFERMFVRDELYVRTVKPKIVITDEERKEGMMRYPYEVKVEVLAVIAQRDADMLRRKVTLSRQKTATMKLFSDSLYVPVDTLTVTYGSTQKHIEDVIFSIGKDSLSRTVQMESGQLAMFRLLSWETKKERADVTLQDRLHKVDKVIEARKEEIQARKAFGAMTSKHRAESDPKIFFRIADSVLAILRADSAAYASQNLYRFSGSAMEKLQRAFSPEWNRPFVTLDSGMMTIGDVLQGLANNNILIPRLSPEMVRLILNNNIKTVLQNEILAREAMRQNLHRTPKVRHDVGIWMDSHKNFVMTRAVIDTIAVTDKDVEQEYAKQPQEYGARIMVRMKEILTDSLPLANEMVRRIVNGEEFETLARKYSTRKEWAALGGVSPWFDAQRNGELGLFAANAHVGELTGPRKTALGYTVFILTDKRIEDDSVKAAWDSVKQVIEAKVRNERQKETLNRYLADLAKKYDVSIDENALTNVPTTTTSMVTWRNLGFGGRVLAVPQTFRQTEWYNEFKKQILVHP